MNTNVHLVINFHFLRVLAYSVDRIDRSMLGKDDEFHLPSINAVFFVFCDLNINDLNNLFIDLSSLNSLKTLFSDKLL